ncbi:CTP synthase [Candidatus Micrarchaeota archaeon CG10_big_fil_rev_8_21_14_0_10_45_29]|nr:MAG: CTP synthase [Candidatus Micrarchaeota archaeon CG10_big_fil_rev_8_21_14_0_10_45_29]
MPEKKARYIVILGSMMSGLGKGILSASIGRLLQSDGYSVAPIKFDGYLNVDCGTMNPLRHGEVFVLDDGTECDMDFGTYERFLNIGLSGTSSITGGKLFKKIIEKERSGGYLGRDVQIVPHLTNEIKAWIRKVGEETKADFVMIEVGGTVGDLENSYFIEAMRQMGQEERENMLFVQLTYVPSLSKGELKTKPTQHANRLITSLGITPKLIVCRGDEKLSKEAREKISMFCNVLPEDVFDDPLVPTIYELPLVLEKQNFSHRLLSHLSLKPRNGDMRAWTNLVSKIKSPKNELRIAITGKYTAVKDAYVSIEEALVHSAAASNTLVKAEFVDTERLERTDVKPHELLRGYDGIIVPGGFGSRGVEGKIMAINYARKNSLPFLGLCLGLQLCVVEYARNVAKMEGAHSTEMDKATPFPVIDLLPEQKSIKEKGATMRLGAWDCQLVKGTKAHDAYGCEKISERHRHRLEVNDEFVSRLEEAGLIISGRSPDGKIVEMVEWKDGWGVATQAHPELKSRLEMPAPLFLAFVKACLKRQKEKTSQ